MWLCKTSSSSFIRIKYYCYYCYKTENKKMMRYLNKQIFGMSHIGIGRQSKKCENEGGREGVSNIAALITMIRNPNPYPCIFEALICFNLTLKCQQTFLMMLLCVNLLNSPTLAQMKIYLPNLLGNWKVHHYSLVL